MISTTGRHPTIQDLAQHFSYEHLQPPLKEFSLRCHDLAESMIESLPDSTQLAMGLQDLLRAKDCFVRAALAKRDADAIQVSTDLQEIRKAAIADLDARLARITPENPMGVELPADDHPPLEFPEDAADPDVGREQA